MKPVKTFIITIILAALPAAFAAPAAAQPSPMKITLQDALALARERNPMLAAARHEADAATARTGMAKAALRPAMSATAFLTGGDMNGIIGGALDVMPTPSVTFESGRFADQNLMLMWPLDVSGRLSARARRAHENAGAAGLEAEAARQRVLFDVHAAFNDALFQKERAASYEAALKAAEEQLANDRVALEAGKIPAFYVSRDEAQAADARRMLNEASRDYSLALLMLAEAMGISPDTQLSAEGTLEPPDGLSETAAGTTEAPPETAAARARAAAAEAGLATARKAYAPDLSLSLMSDMLDSRNGDSMRGTAAALVFTLPVSDGGMRRSAIREAGAETAAAAEELRATELRLKTALAAAELEYNTAVSNIAAGDAAIKSAEAAYEVAKLRYEAGKGILVEVLDAAAMLTQARISRLSAVRDALNAKYRYLSLSGTL